MIQLWSIPCDPARDELNYELPDVEDKQASRASMKLEVGFCIEGDVGEIAWCPRGGFSASTTTTSDHAIHIGEPKDALSQSGSKGKGKGKTPGRTSVQAGTVNDEVQEGSPGTADQDNAPHLGIVAAVMADGALAFFAIPTPTQVRAAHAAGSVAPSAPFFGELQKVPVGTTSPEAHVNGQDA